MSFRVINGEEVSGETLGPAPEATKIGFRERRRGVWPQGASRASARGEPGTPPIVLFKIFLPHPAGPTVPQELWHPPISGFPGRMFSNLGGVGFVPSARVSQLRG